MNEEKSYEVHVVLSKYASVMVKASSEEEADERACEFVENGCDETDVDGEPHMRYSPNTEISSSEVFEDDEE